MSIPTNSIGPTPPSGSSNPVSLKSWWIAIIDWIKGLSPAGASSYDTGWVAVPILAPAAANWTSQLEVRRIGKTVVCRGQFAANAAGSLTAAFLNLGSLPVGFRPPSFQTPGMSWNNAANAQMRIEPSGNVAIRTPAGTTAYTTFAAPTISNSVWTVD